MTRPLTQREADVLRYAAQGYPVRIIAARLGRAASTVHSILRRATAALGVRTVDQAIQLHNQPTPPPVPAPTEDAMDTPAQIAYHAYGAATGGLTHTGRPMPTWDQLGRTIQHAWAAAAQAVLDAAAPAAPPTKKRATNRAERRRR
ncbi:helix-turn-helix transcriptional regulator [Kitasatospora sp. NPDC127116]|uniref:helix-turn-helix domain-containing protein n=1 Tax=Kitasatospora sp. NPDC127116 TaxID=3345367 RepID=UPI003644093E